MPDMRFLRIALLLAFPLMLACSSKGGAGAACQSSSDCASNESCVYAFAARCAAKPTCQPNPTGAPCGEAVPYCACDGGVVFVGCGAPGGYSFVPTMGPGTCPAAPGDAGRD
jgi:hypothetical protein